MKKGLMYAWLSLSGSFLILAAVDYVLRITTGDIKTGGINFIVFWSLWLPCITFSLYWIFYASKQLQSLLSSILFMFANIVAAVFVVLILSLLYTVGLGIDSL